MNPGGATATIHGDPAIASGTYDSLIFMLLPSTGRVHIQAGEAAQVRLQERAGVERERDDGLAMMIALMLGPMAALCGDFRPTGRDDTADPRYWRRVEVFDDLALCEACRRALGPDAALAFNHPQPDDDPEDP